MTYKEFYEACDRADKRMKEADGHQMIHILKTRCQLCHRSPRQKGKCSKWIKTLLDNLYQELYPND